MTKRFLLKVMVALVLSLLSTGCGLSRLIGADEKFEQGFMEACKKGVDYEEYCKCALDEVVANTNFLERFAPNEKIKNRGVLAGKKCLSTVPPPSVKKEFVEQCVAGSHAPQFCECSFEHLRKKGLLSEGEEGVTREQSAMKEACRTQLFDDTRSLFIESCKSNAGASGDAKCSCMFGKLEEKFGRDGLLKEFEANGAPLQVATEQAVQACQ